jgi:hypothetical protein
MTAQLMDPFDAYPMDLSAIMNPMPAGWWAPMPPSGSAPAAGPEPGATWNHEMLALPRLATV